ncbi:MAG: hypothetical protein FWF71_00995 [Actinomycetia bacterium]|nr:hypothetical protein [Actinomycetes bacterium]
MPKLKRSIIERDLTERGVAFFRLDGSTPKITRQQLVEHFNSGDTPVFLISLMALFEAE